MKNALPLYLSLSLAAVLSPAVTAEEAVTTQPRLKTYGKPMACAA